MRETPLYIGTYSAGTDAEGIYRAYLDEQTGALNDIACVAEAVNPSFLCVSQDGFTLFAVAEGRDGAVCSYRTGSGDDPLTLISQQSSHGRAPCYVSVLDRYLLTANYMSGTVAAFQIDDEGALSPASSVIQHSGKGPNQDRQDGPHAHSIIPVPETTYILAVDLGTDEVITYELEDSGKLVRRSVFNTEPGAGPRHIAFHPTEPYLFILNELNNTLVLCRYDATNGRLSHVATLPTLPDDFAGDSIAADIHTSQDGRFVYCTNRGHESIAVFDFDSDSTVLTRLQIIGCGGEHPRNFMISPNGRYLLCANQNTHNIVTFEINIETGLLSATGVESTIPMPVCLCPERP